MRRSEWEAYVKKRKRQRRTTALAIVSVLAVAGVVVYFVKFAPHDRTAKPLASGSAVSCSTKVPAAAAKKKGSFKKPVDQKLDPKKTYVWRLETSCGTLDVKLDVKRHPITTNSIAYLTRKHFYDGTFFHRVTKNVVIQGGDPTGLGSGGSGYKVVEPPAKSTKYTDGIVAMAKTGTDPSGTSESQFFITAGSPGFTPDYAVAGKVTPQTKSMIKKITDWAGNEQDFQPPKHKVYIVKATIVEQ